MVERINFRVAVRGAAQSATNFNNIAAAIQSVNAAVAATAKAFAKSGAEQIASSNQVAVNITNNYKSVASAAAGAAQTEKRSGDIRRTSIFKTLGEIETATNREVAATIKANEKRLADDAKAAQKAAALQKKATADAEAEVVRRTREIERIEERSRARRLAQLTAFLGRIQSVATTTGAAVVRALGSLGTIGPSLNRSLGAIESQLNSFGKNAGESFVGGLIKTITNGFAVIPKLIGQLVGPITSSIGIVIKAAGASFVALGATIGGALGTALSTINPILGGIVGLATSAAGAIAGAFVSGIGAVTQIFGSLLQGVTGVMSGLINVVGSAVAKIADLLSSLSEKIFSAVGTLVENTVGKVVGAIGGLFGTLGGIVSTGLKTVFSPIGLIIGGLSIKAAADIRDRVVNTFALLDDKTQSSVDAVTRRLSELAARIGVPVTEIGDAFFSVVSAGFRDLGAAIEILEQAANLAVAGSARVSDTTKNLITLLRATKAPAEAAGRAAQFFFDVQDRGVITIQELSTSFPDLVSAIIAAKIPLEEVGALFSVLTLQGQSASETATQLQQVILNLVAPIPQARRRMAALGLEIRELSDADRDVIEGLENQLFALQRRNKELEAGTEASRLNKEAIKQVTEELTAQLQVRGRFVGITEALRRIRTLLRELDAEDTAVSRAIVSRIRAVKGLTFLADNIDLVGKRAEQVGKSPEKFIEAIDLATQKVGVQIRQTIGELRQLGLAIFNLGVAVTGGNGFETVREAIRGLRSLIESVTPAVAEARTRLLGFKDTLVAAFAPLTSLNIFKILDGIGDAFAALIERFKQSNIGAAITGALEGFVSGVSGIISGARVTDIFNSIRDGARRAQREVSSLRGGEVEVSVDARGAEEAQRQIRKLAETLEDQIGGAANTAGLAIDNLFSSARVGAGLEEGVNNVRSSLSSDLVPLFRSFQDEVNEILAGIGVDPIEVELPDLDTISLSTQGIDEAREGFRNLERDARIAVTNALREVQLLTDPKASDIKIAVDGIDTAEQQIKRLAGVVTDSLGEAATKASSDLERLALTIGIGQFDEDVFNEAKQTIDRFITGSSNDLQDFQNFANAQLAAIGAEPVDFDFSALERARKLLEDGVVLGEVDVSAVNQATRILQDLFRQTGESVDQTRDKILGLLEPRTGEVEFVANVSQARADIESFANGIETRLAALSSQASRNLSDISGSVAVDDEQLEAAGRRLNSFVDRARRELSDFASFTNTALQGIDPKRIEIDFQDAEAAAAAVKLLEDAKFNIDLTELNAAQAQLEKGLRLGEIDVSTLDAVRRALEAVGVQFKTLQSGSERALGQILSDVEQLAEERRGTVRIDTVGIEEALREIGKLAEESEKVVRQLEEVEPSIDLTPLRAAQEELSKTLKLGDVDTSSLEAARRALEAVGVQFEVLQDGSNRSLDQIISDIKDLTAERRGTVAVNVVGVPAALAEIKKISDSSEELVKRLQSIEPDLDLTKLQGAIRALKADLFLDFNEVDTTALDAAKKSLEEVGIQFKSLQSGSEESFAKILADIERVTQERTGTIKVDVVGAEAAAKKAAQIFFDLQSAAKKVEEISPEIDLSSLRKAQVAFAQALKLGKIDTTALDAAKKSLEEIGIQLKTLQSGSEESLAQVVKDIEELTQDRTGTISINAVGVEKASSDINKLSQEAEARASQATNSIEFTLGRLSRLFVAGAIDSSSLDSASKKIDSFVDDAISRLNSFQRDANKLLSGIRADAVAFDFSEIEAARQSLQEGIKVGKIDIEALETIEKSFADLSKQARDSVAEARDELGDLGTGVGDSVSSGVDEATGALDRIGVSAKDVVRIATGEFRQISRVIAGEGEFSKTIIGSAAAFIAARFNLAVARIKLDFETISGIARSVASSTINAFGALADGTVRIAAQGLQAATRFIFKAFDEVGGLGGLIKLALFGPNEEQLLRINTILQDALNAEVVGQQFRQSLAGTLTDIQLKIQPTIDPENTAIGEFAVRLSKQIEDAVSEKTDLDIAIKLKSEDLDALKKELSDISKADELRPGIRFGGPAAEKMRELSMRIREARVELEAMEKRSSDLTGQIALSNVQFDQMSVSVDKVKELTELARKAEADRLKALQDAVEAQERLTATKVSDLEAAILVAKAAGDTVAADKLRLDIQKEIARQEDENARKISEQLERVARFPSRISTVLDSLKDASDDQKDAILAVLRQQKDLLSSEEDLAKTTERRVELTKELLAVTKELGLSTAETLELINNAADPFNVPLPQVQRPAPTVQPRVSTAPVPIDTGVSDALNAALRGDLATQTSQLVSSGRSLASIDAKLSGPLEVAIDQAFFRRVREILTETGITPGVGGFVGQQQLARGEGIIPLTGGVPLDLIRDVFQQSAIGIQNVGLSAEVLLDAVQSLRQEARTGEAPGRRVGETEGFQVRGGRITGITPNAVQSEIGQEILKSLAGREAVLQLLDSQGLQIRHLDLIEAKLREQVELQKQALANELEFQRNFGGGAGGTGGGGGSTLQGVRRADVNELKDALGNLGTTLDALKAAEAQKAQLETDLRVAVERGDPAAQQAADEGLETIEAEIKKLKDASTEATDAFSTFAKGNKAFTGLVQEFTALGKIDTKFLDDLSKADLRKLGRDSNAIQDADLRTLIRDAARGNKEALDAVKRAQEEAKGKIEGGGGAADDPFAAVEPSLTALKNAASDAATELAKIAADAKKKEEEAATTPEGEGEKGKAEEATAEAAKDIANAVKDALKEGEQQGHPVPPELQPPPIPEVPLPPAEGETPGEIVERERQAAEEARRRREAEDAKKQGEEKGTEKPGEKKKEDLDTKKVQEALKEQIKAVEEALQKQLEEVLESQKEVNESTKKALESQSKMVEQLDMSLQRIGESFDRTTEKFENTTEEFGDFTDEMVELGQKIVGVLEEHDVKIKENAEAIAALDVRVSALGG